MPYYDDDDDRAYPGTVTAAGVLWIIFGVISILYAGLSVIGGMAPPNGMAAEARVGFMVGAVCAGGFVGLIGIAFIVVGVMSVSNKIKDTIGPAIGSVVLGMLFLGMGAIGFAAVREPLVLIMWGFLAGMILLPGVLGFVGREGLRRYRRARRRFAAPPPPPRRSRQYDDDYE